MQEMRRMSTIMTQITDEMIEAAENKAFDKYGHALSRNGVMSILEAALAAQTQEPVGYTSAPEIERVSNGNQGRVNPYSGVKFNIPLYTAPPPQAVKVKALNFQDWVEGQSLDGITGRRTMRKAFCAGVRFELQRSEDSGVFSLRRGENVGDWYVVIGGKDHGPFRTDVEATKFANERNEHRILSALQQEERK